MSATKKAVRTTYSSWDEANDGLKRLAEIEREVTKKEASMNGKIDAMKAGYAEDVKPLLEEKEEIERDLELWCRDRREDFGAAQSKVMAFGTVWFRKSAALVMHSAQNTLAAIKKMMGERAPQFITVKESPNKEALEKLPVDELRALGCKRQDKESFGYDINWERLE